MQKESMIGGDDTNRKMYADMKVAIDNEEPESPVVNWLKISGLLIFTFGLILLIWVIR